MNELARALIGSSAAAPPKNILQAIPEVAAHQKPVATAGSAPHSIYDEVWHMAYWQGISLDWIQGKPTIAAKQASDGFPIHRNESWDDLRTRFLAGTQNAAAIANDTERLEVVVQCPSPSAHDRPVDMTVREQLESLAAHNAYHLGRIVLLRQLLNNWPPPDGGYPW
jgi:uncharacterized damage-inducible protein DinB